MKSTGGNGIGDLLIIGFDGTEMSARLSSLLTRVQPAGVVLFGRNIQTADQTWRLLADCQKYVEAPLFTCVDLEGGRVDRFRQAIGPAPSAADVFNTGDRALFRKHGFLIGSNCRPGHQPGFRPRPRPRIRSLAQRHEFPRGFSQPQRSREIRP